MKEGEWKKKVENFWFPSALRVILGITNTFWDGAFVLFRLYLATKSALKGFIKEISLKTVAYYKWEAGTTAWERKLKTVPVCSEAVQSNIYIYMDPLTDAVIIKEKFNRKKKKVYGNPTVSQSILKYGSH